ncbi:lysine biosynthesis protein LysX [Candidatus Bathyarchaeota archaeon]|nr:lysine biosynthesis protein LysX [Candidatus Bathyarchaeota archaeon]
MTLGMLYDQVRYEEKRLIDAAKQRELQFHTVDAKEVNIDLTDPNDKLGFDEVVLQRCVSYFRSLHLTAALESKGVKVINSFEITKTCGNKLLTTLLLSKAGIPTPKTMVAFTPETALQTLNEIGYPAILKPVIGSWGRMVAPLKDAETARAILEEREYMFPIYQVYYIQEMVKRPPRDIRVILVGDEIVAGIYRYAPSNDWRTNVARGGRAERCQITKELEEICFKVIKVVGEGVLGIDLMESPEGLLVHEVNHTPEFRGAETATSIDIADKILSYALSWVKSK